MRKNLSTKIRNVIFISIWNCAIAQFLVHSSSNENALFTHEETWMFVKDYAWILGGAVIIQLESAKLQNGICGEK